jgi:flagellar basal-body rod modification protein FlgD
MLINPSSTAAAPTDGRTGADRQQLDEDLNKFLNLLVTQLQHQDPLEPLDANAFTQQLVQFASVEQQIYQNAHLEDLLAAEREAQTASMVAYLDRTIEARTSSLPLVDGTARAAYTLSAAAKETEIVIRDDAGRIVYTLSGATEPGRHLIDWDGTNADGTRLPDGLYSVHVVANDRTGEAIEADISVFGTVDGAAVDADGPHLRIGDLAVRLADVIAVTGGPTTNRYDDPEA